MNNAILTWNSLELILDLVIEIDLFFEAFEFALAKGKTKVARYFVENAIDDDEINLKNKGGDTLITIACFVGNLEIVEYLVKERKGDLNISHNDLTSPLYLSCYFNRLEIVKFLVENGALVNAQNKGGLTPFSIACQRNCLDVVKYLLQNKDVDVNKPSNDGTSPFFGACNADSPKIVNCLVEQKEREIDFEKFIDCGENALTICCYHGFFEVVQILVEKAKVNINVRNENRKTPLGIATSCGNHEIADYLRKHGAKK